MPRVDGIGGAFLFSPDPKRLARWYERAFSLQMRPLDGGIYYVVLRSWALRHPKKKVGSVFAVFPMKGRRPKLQEGPVLNFRVDDLEAYARRWKRLRVRAEPIATGPDGEGEGKFTHLEDADGNQVEVWEPSKGV